MIITKYSHIPQFSTVSSRGHAVPEVNYSQAKKMPLLYHVLAIPRELVFAFIWGFL